MNLRIETQKSSAGKWFWMIKNKRGKLLAVSHQGYARQETANRAVTNTIKIIYHAINVYKNEKVLPGD